jgi:ParB-like chromosome segregation protein Spo0J
MGKFFKQAEAESKSQQRLMGMVYAYEKGKLNLAKLPASLQKKIKNISKSMTNKEVKDYAETKHKGLPEVKKASLTLQLFNKLAAYNVNFTKLMNAFKNQKIHKNTQGALLNIISKNKNLTQMSNSRPEHAVQGALKVLRKTNPNKGKFISTPMGGKPR